jgi:hypothetical protein
MTTSTHPLRGSVLGAGLLALVLLLAAPAPAPAAPPSVAAAAPVVFAGTPWYQQAYDFLADFVSNRTRMIQFAFVAVIIGLIIICWNKW